MKVAIQRHRLLFEIGQVWIAGSLANLLFYLFHLVVGRSLDSEDYSLFGALFGIVYLSGALANGVRFSVERFVASSRAGAGGGDPGMVVSSALLQMVLLGAGLVVAFSLASPFIGSYLHSNRHHACPRYRPVDIHVHPYAGDPRHIARIPKVHRIRRHPPPPMPEAACYLDWPR